MTCTCLEAAEAPVPRNKLEAPPTPGIGIRPKAKDAPGHRGAAFEQSFEHRLIKGVPSPSHPSSVPCRPSRLDWATTY